MYRAGVDAEEGPSRRLSTSIRKAKIKRYTMLQVRRRSRFGGAGNSAIDAAAPRSEAVSPSEPRQLSFNTAALYHNSNTGNDRVRLDALVTTLCASSDPRALAGAASSLVQILQTLDCPPLQDGNQWGAAVVPRVVILLAAASAASAPYFFPCLSLLNELLSREELSGPVSLHVVRCGLVVVLTRVLLLGEEFMRIKETAVLVLGNCAAYFANCGMSSWSTPRSSSSSKDLSHIVSSVPGVIDALQSLLLGHTGSPELKSLVLWSLANILSPRGQRCPGSREAFRRFAVLVPALLSCATAADSLSTSSSSDSFSSSSSSSSSLSPSSASLYCVSSTSSVVTSSLMSPSAPVPRSRFSSSSSSTKSLGGCTTRLRALTVLESLTRFGGEGLQALVRSIGGIPYLTSLIASDQHNTNSEITVEALKIIGHVFEGNSPEGVQLCLNTGSLPLLCGLASNHNCTDVRFIAVKALHDFIQCPREIVSPTIASYLGHGGGSDVSPVIMTLVQKCRPHGDMVLRVREKASFGVLNVARLKWIDAKIRETLVGSLACLLRAKNTQIVQESIEAIDTLLSTRNIHSLHATAPRAFSSSSPCVSSRLVHIFEAAGGLASLEVLLTATHMALDETKVEQLLAKHFPSTQTTSMELDDDEKSSLLVEFGDTVDANGRLW